jgi:hypothetical protein
MQGRMRDALRSRRSRLGLGVIGMVAAAVVIAVALPAGAGANKRAFYDVHRTKAFWHKTSLKTALDRRGARPALRLRAGHDRSFTLNRSALRKVLGAAPRERTRAARLHPVVVSLPVPNGRFQRFALARSAIMSPGLARRHPEIRTYSGRGIDDPAATIHADLSPIGFHASVRSPEGAWYIDPYLRNDVAPRSATTGGSSRAGTPSPSATPRAMRAPTSSPMPPRATRPPETSSARTGSR